MVSNAERRAAAPPDAVRPDAALYRHRKGPCRVRPRHPGVRLGGIAAPRNRRQWAGPPIRRPVSAGAARAVPHEPLPSLANPSSRGRLLRAALCAGAACCGDQLRRARVLLAEVLRAPNGEAGGLWRTSAPATGQRRKRLPVARRLPAVAVARAQSSEKRHLSSVAD